MIVLLGMVTLALIATPASAGLINGGFEAGLAGWTTTNVVINSDQGIPSPPTMEGVNRAGDGNCDSRTGGGSQTAICLAPPAPDCTLTGYLAGNGQATNRYVRISGPCGMQEVIFPGGSFNWQPVELTLPDCCESEILVEFGQTGNGSWGSSGYHVDAFVLECTPEPTSLALICLAGLPLLRRRR